MFIHSDVNNRNTFASRVTYAAANAVANSPSPSVSNWLFPPNILLSSDSSCWNVEAVITLKRQSTLYPQLILK